METTVYEDCTDTIQAHVYMLFAECVTAGSLFHQMEAKKPMGFTWYVVLPHAFMQSCKESAYADLVHENPWLDGRLQFLRDQDAPFMVTPRRPLILLILDDQATITCGWSNALVRILYRKL